jgi:DNA-binding response OmpR family regulator
MGRIALIEDHERFSNLVRRALSNSGIESDVFHNLEVAWQSVRSAPYSVFVVDRRLPDGDGLNLVRQLRAHGCQTPCLMLTARDALHDRIEGLESGADDYLVKPFSMEELIARVRALMRRPATIRTLTPRFADLTVHPNSGCMTCGYESVSLAPAELQIMLSLVSAAGATVRRTALETTAWGLADAVTPNALDVAVHRLRKKLHAVDSRLQIESSRGHGYVLREIPLAQ